MKVTINWKFTLTNQVIVACILNMLKWFIKRGFKIMKKNNPINWRHQKESKFKLPIQRFFKEVICIFNKKMVELLLYHAIILRVGNQTFFKSSTNHIFTVGRKFPSSQWSHFVLPDFLLKVGHILAFSAMIWLNKMFPDWKVSAWEEAGKQKFCFKRRWCHLNFQFGTI